MIEFVVPEQSDVRYLAENLRPEDVRELLTLKPDADIKKILEDCVSSSDFARVVRKDGVPVVIFGSQKTADEIAKVGAKAADIWLLGTDEIKLNKTSFLKLSKKVIEEIAEPFDYLWNVVDPRNDLHVRWLQWLGFSFPFEYPVNDELKFLVAVRYT